VADADAARRFAPSAPIQVLPDNRDP